MKDNRQPQGRKLVSISPLKHSRVRCNCACVHFVCFSESEHPCAVCGVGPHVGQNNAQNQFPITVSRDWLASAPLGYAHTLIADTSLYLKTLPAFPRLMLWMCLHVHHVSSREIQGEEATVPGSNPPSMLTETVQKSTAPEHCGRESSKHPRVQVGQNKPVAGPDRQIHSHVLWGSCGQPFS